jgi:hypothetical protein
VGIEMVAFEPQSAHVAQENVWAETKEHSDNNSKRTQKIFILLN